MSRSDDGKVNGETVIDKLDATSHGHRYRWLTLISQLHVSFHDMLETG